MRKISIMLEEIGLPYAVKYIDPHDGEDVDTEFAKVSPTGTVPAIMDTDTGASLFESVAILQYLAEKNGNLLPKKLSERAEVLKWLTFESANICPTMIEIHHYIMNDAGDLPSAILERYQNKLEQYCAILNTQLENKEYLAGEYSIADIAIYPWMVALEDMADIQLKDFPNLNIWANTIASRNTVQNTATDLAVTDWCYNSGVIKLCRAS